MKTVESFWAYYSNMLKPSDLPANFDVCFFKDGFYVRCFPVLPRIRCSAKKGTRFIVCSLRMLLIKVTVYTIQPLCNDEVNVGGGKWTARLRKGQVGLISFAHCVYKYVDASAVRAFLRPCIP